jgi:hypothetical protein
MSRGAAKKNRTLDGCRDFNGNAGLSGGNDRTIRGGSPTLLIFRREVPMCLLVGIARAGDLTLGQGYCKP